MLNLQQDSVEFFAMGQSEDFLIWNLQKGMNKPAHVIHFKRTLI